MVTRSFLPARAPIWRPPFDLRPMTEAEWIAARADVIEVTMTGRPSRAIGDDVAAGGAVLVVDRLQLRVHVGSAVHRAHRQVLNPNFLDRLLAT